MRLSISYRLWYPCFLAFAVASAFSPTLAADPPSGPRVPGFERFFNSQAADLAEGGRLLLRELNCTSCPAADDGLLSPVRPKQAPILDNVGARVRPE